MRIERITERFVSEVVAVSPRVAGVFVRHGMGCVGCAFARFETVREAAVAHGLDPDALAISLARAMPATKGKME